MKGSYLAILLYCSLSMLSCEKNEEFFSEDLPIFPSQQSYNLISRMEHSGQYNFTIEIDTMHSSSAILQLEWGDENQVIQLVFTNPKHKIVHSISTLKNTVSNYFWLKNISPVDRYHFQILHNNKGYDIYLNGELLAYHNQSFTNLSYFKFDTYNTYNVTYFSIK